jgi:hypothetical protein
MAKSKKRKGHNARVEKRNMMAAREMMHSAKRKANLEDNLAKFQSILKEFAIEADEKAKKEGN